MDRVMRGECGYEVSSDAEVVAAAQAHAWDAHGMESRPNWPAALPPPSQSVLLRGRDRDESR